MKQEINYQRITKVGLEELTTRVKEVLGVGRFFTMNELRKRIPGYKVISVHAALKRLNVAKVGEARATRYGFEVDSQD